MTTRDIQLYDIHLSAPSGWVDQTIVMFQGPPAAADGYAPKFLVSRHPRTPQTNLQMFAAGVAERFAKRLEEFEILENRPYRLHEHAAHLLSFRFQGPQGQVTQYQILVPGLHDTVLSISAAALSSEFQAYEDTFNGLLASIRLPLDPP